MQSKCPECQSENIYQNANLWICPECGHEWVEKSLSSSDSSLGELQNSVIKDAHGNILQDGDSVVVLKDLKLKGSSSVIKGGTKAKNISLILNAHDGHNISCRIDGVGSINLKSEFVKKG
jgi:protein PhnA